MSKLTPCRTATRLRAVVIRSSSSTAASDLSRVDQLPRRGARRARRGGRSRRRRRCASCRAGGRRGSASTSIAGSRRDRQAVAARAIASTSLAQLRRLGEAQRRQQAEPDRLAVAVALVAARRLDRVADRVAEVEHVAAGRRRARRRRRPRTCSGRRRRRRRRGSAGSSASSARTRSQSAPPASRPVFSTSTKPAASSSRRQRRQRRGVGDHRGGQVVGAGVVLALAAGRRRSCRRRRSRPGRPAWSAPDDRHAALVEVGAEAGEVADDAAAEGDDVVLAGHPGRGHRPARSPTTPPPSATTWSSLVIPARASSRRTRSASAIVFAPSPGVDLDARRRSGSSALARRAADGAVSVTQKRAPGSGHQPRLEQAAPDEDRVLAGGARRPEQLGPGRQLGERLERRAAPGATIPRSPTGTTASASSS